MPFWFFIISFKICINSCDNSFVIPDSISLEKTDSVDDFLPDISLPEAVIDEKPVVEPVIDKDLASSKLAIMLRADYLIILTTVNHAELNFGKPNHQILEKITTSEAKQYLNDGHFAKGSMKPKIEAAINFVNETNNKAIITGLDNLSNALNEIDCTVIVK